MMWVEPKETAVNRLSITSAFPNGAEQPVSGWRVHPIPPDELADLQRYAADVDAAYAAWGRGELDQYEGQWVAFCNNRFAGADKDLAGLCDRVAAEHGISAGLVSTLYVETLWTRLQRLSS